MAKRAGKITSNFQKITINTPSTSEITGISLPTGNIAAGNINISGNAQVTNLTANGMTLKALDLSKNLKLADATDLNIGGGLANYYLQTIDGAGNLRWSLGIESGVAGSNQQIQLNNNGFLTTASNFYYDSGPGWLYSPKLAGDGGYLWDVPKASVVGNVPNANVASSANYAGNITLGSQPNITSVGTLANLDVQGLANIGNLVVTGNLITLGNTTQLQANSLRTSATIIEMGGEAGGNALTVDDSLDRGITLHDYSSNATIDRYFKWDNINREFVIDDSSGGVVYERYTYVFTVNGSHSVPDDAANISYVLVGGGGGGGAGGGSGSGGGGGGGEGGQVAFAASANELAGLTLTITIGQGGQGGVGDNSLAGTAGGPGLASSIVTNTGQSVTILGGAGGQSPNDTNTTAAGGNGSAFCADGGAGSDWDLNVATARRGQDGSQVSIAGQTLYFGGGGGGGATAGRAPAAGGMGGGGRGGNGTNDITLDGHNGRGGGGGGGRGEGGTGGNGGNGGSGIFIITYTRPKINLPLNVIKVFTTSTTFKIPASTYNIQYLLVGGGGGGASGGGSGPGNGGGGGEGGQVVTGSDSNLAGKNITITIGAGGGGGASVGSGAANGGAAGTATIIQSGTTIYQAQGGNGGGTAGTNNSVAAPGGSGAGAGDGGQGSSWVDANIQSSDGAAGVTSSLVGFPITYGSGGGGGGANGRNSSSGGKDGGGRGGSNFDSINGVAGVNGLGGGGGGGMGVGAGSSSGSGGRGGDGVVVLRYSTYVPAVLANTLQGVLKGAASTVSENAQPNITSMGTLSNLTVLGNSAFSSATYVDMYGGTKGSVVGVVEKLERVMVEITTTGPGSYAMPASATDIEVLMIAGGGGGSWGNSSDNASGRGGGGGEGGEVYYRIIGNQWAGKTLSYSVGEGGQGAVRGGTTASTNGGNTSVTVDGTTITALGGTRGGNGPSDVGDNWIGGTGRQGSDGGDGAGYNGGGGSNGTAGKSYRIYNASYVAGAGGGGGGGGSNNTATWQGGGAGGTGGGGSGGTGQFYVNNAGNGGAGTNGTGGGGGGGGGSSQAASNGHSSGGGAGGSGRLLISYAYMPAVNTTTYNLSMIGPTDSVDNLDQNLLLDPFHLATYLTSANVTSAGRGIVSVTEGTKQTFSPITYTSTNGTQTVGFSTQGVGGIKTNQTAVFGKGFKNTVTTAQVPPSVSMVNGLGAAASNVVVTVSTTTSGVTLSGNTTATSNGNGVATFTGLTFSASSYTNNISLTFSCNVDNIPLSTTQSNITFQDGATIKIVQPAVTARANVVASAVFHTAPNVMVVSTPGANLTGKTVTVSGANLGLSGTTTVTLAPNTAEVANGIAYARFANLSSNLAQSTTSGSLTFSVTNSDANVTQSNIAAVIYHTGGAITRSANWVYHTFLGSASTQTMSFGKTQANVEYLVVGAGGRGGGGGAVIAFSGATFQAQGYAMSVGVGSGTRDTTFNGVTATGGNGGTASGNTAAGFGRGGASGSGTAGGSTNGGAGDAATAVTIPPNTGTSGGGGGAGGFNLNGGNGGAGTTWSVNGQTYGAGGGGGAGYNLTRGTGGAGGGGNGANSNGNNSVSGSQGTDGTGGGGGGAYGGGTGGWGGNGTVIIAYPLAEDNSYPVGGGIVPSSTVPASDNTYTNVAVATVPAANTALPTTGSAQMTNYLVAMTTTGSGVYETAFLNSQVGVASGREYESGLFSAGHQFVFAIELGSEVTMTVKLYSSDAANSSIRDLTDPVTLVGVPGMNSKLLIINNKPLPLHTVIRLQVKFFGPAIIGPVALIPGGSVTSNFPQTGISVYEAFRRVADVTTYTGLTW